MDFKFKSPESELRYIREKIITSYLTASTKPENCQDSKNMLTAIKEILEPYYEYISNGCDGNIFSENE